MYRVHLFKQNVAGMKESDPGPSPNAVTQALFNGKVQNARLYYLGLTPSLLCLGTYQNHSKQTKGWEALQPWSGAGGTNKRLSRWCGLSTGTSPGPVREETRFQCYLLSSQRDATIMCCKLRCIMPGFRAICHEGQDHLGPLGRGVGGPPSQQPAKMAASTAISLWNHPSASSI